MLKKIETSSLNVGMYIILPVAWNEHPFLKNQFILKSKKQIKKILDYGIKEITIDITKGKCNIEFLETLSHSDKDMAPSEKWKSESFVSKELEEAIKDQSIPPQKKAKAVYGYSIEIMNKVIDNPSIENIKTGKEHIAAVVDVILSDDETSNQLLNITSHDFYTYTHSVNVGILSIMLSKALLKYYSTKLMHELGAGFFLHDLGKVNVDSNIINKPGRLTKEEMFKMRTHPFQGFKLLKAADQLSEECKIIVMQHHEREDGTGYPKRLKGDEIHLYGRISSIADIFDALTAERSYKKKLTPFEALSLMKKEMSNHFNKEIFNNFVMLFKT
ncbi:MAG: HD-GYP domain-containing protein [Candidatus Scalindua sp.]